VIPPNEGATLTVDLPHVANLDPSLPPPHRARPRALDRDPDRHRDRARLDRAFYASPIYVQ